MQLANRSSIASSRRPHHTQPFAGSAGSHTAAAPLATARRHACVPCARPPPRSTTIRRVAAPEVVQASPAPASQQTAAPPQPADGAAAPPAAAADAFQPITAMWSRLAASLGQQTAMLDPHRSPQLAVSYSELNDSIHAFAAGLQAAGHLQQGDRVCLFAESSPRWIVADQGILLNGAANAVRGSSSPLDELSFILQHSQASGLVVHDTKALAKLVPAIKARVQAGQAIRFVAVLWDEPGSSGSSSAALQAVQTELEGSGVTVLSYDQVLAAGRQQQQGSGFTPAAVSRSDLATLVYTSGTTGHPKGVMLTHGNLASQVDHLDFFLPVAPGDSTLSLLPPWHIYQRSTSYYLFSRGAREVFTSLHHFRSDLTAHPPDHFVCVPLVLDTLYSKVMAKLKAEAKGAKGAIVSALLSASYAFIAARRVVTGTSLLHALNPPSAAQRLLAAATVALLAPVYALAQRLVFSKVRAALGIKQTIISGGGSLAAHLDLFFEALGIPLLNGWGLTETSPVLACRRPAENVRGTVGLPTPGTRVIVVDPVTHNQVPDGQQGLLLASGPGVMAGYWADASATRKALIDGWYDTGDLGWRAPSGVPGSAMAGHIVLTGRAKDTLVLLSGKNIEPQPIEDAICRSPLIKHVIVLGQDKRELGALVFPDEEHLAAAGIDEGQLEVLLAAEVSGLNSARPDHHQEDRIAHIQVVRAPLSVEAGTLTRTMKPRRPVIQQEFAPQVAELMARLRG